jgi:hypothetical protein
MCVTAETLKEYRMFANCYLAEIERLHAAFLPLIILLERSRISLLANPALTSTPLAGIPHVCQTPP